MRQDAVGTPARRVASVVPRPPWCTTQEQRGKSHACGAWHLWQHGNGMGSVKGSLNRQGKKTSKISAPLRWSTHSPLQTWPHRIWHSILWSSHIQILPNIQSNIFKHIQTSTHNSHNPWNKKRRYSWHHVGLPASACSSVASSSQSSPMLWSFPEMLGPYNIVLQSMFSNKYIVLANVPETNISMILSKSFKQVKLCIRKCSLQHWNASANISTICNSAILFS